MFTVGELKFLDKKMLNSEYWKSFLKCKPYEGIKARTSQEGAYVFFFFFFPPPLIENKQPQILKEIIFLKAHFSWVCQSSSVIWPNILTEELLKVTNKVYCILCRCHLLSSLP